MSNFFSKCGKRKGDGLTGSEVRECVRDYVCQEKLQHPTDPTIINLDPIIADVVLVKGENLVVTFRWDKLTSRITSKVKTFEIRGRVEFFKIWSLVICNELRLHKTITYHMSMIPFLDVQRFRNGF